MSELASNSQNDQPVFPWSGPFRQLGKIEHTQLDDDDSERLSRLNLFATYVTYHALTPREKVFDAQNQQIDRQTGLTDRQTWEKLAATVASDEMFTLSEDLMKTPQAQAFHQAVVQSYAQRQMPGESADNLPQ